MAKLNQFNPVQAFQTGRINALTAQGKEQAIAREASAAPIRNQAQELGLKTQQRSFERAGVQNEQSDVLQKAQILNQVAKGIKNLDPSQYAAAFQNIKPKLQSFGIDTSRFEGVEITAQGLDQVIAETQGFISDPSKIAQLSAGQRERGDLKTDLEGAFLPNGKLKDVADMTAIQRSAAIGLKLTPGAGTATSKERIAVDPDLTTKVANSQAKIKSAVKQKEIEAKAKGEAITDLIKQEAALPGIREVVDKLKILSEEATFTLAGKAYNEIAKQFGFSTDGDTARTSMISIVDNQVLPLLKPIFGAAFTAIEGDRLRDAFLNPDSTPESRKASLDAFLEQTVRNIDALKVENSSQTLNSSVLGRAVTEQDIQDTLNDPENAGMTREQLFQQLGIQ